MKTFIVGVDGSEPSIRAANLAASLAKRTDAKLKLVFVVPPIWFPAADYSGAIYVDLHDIQLQRAKELLSGQLENMKEVGVPAETVVLEGNPADELARIADGPEVEMVVVGTGGHGLSHVLLGSVANRLLHRSTKPVLVTH